MIYPEDYQEGIRSNRSEVDHDPGEHLKRSMKPGIGENQEAFGNEPIGHISACHDQHRIDSGGKPTQVTEPTEIIGMKRLIHENVPLKNPLVCYHEQLSHAPK